MISLIAAVGKNGELGSRGELVFHIREDMRFFRSVTKGHKVIMGRKTWESLPGKLPGRENIVISSREIKGPDLVVHDLGGLAIRYVDSTEEVFVIGGGAIYAEFLPYAENIYLTEVDMTASDADVFFPEFDKSKYRRELIKQGSEGGVDFAMVRYKRKP